MNRRQLLQSVLALPLLTVPAAAHIPKSLFVVPHSSYRAYRAWAKPFDYIDILKTSHGLTGKRYDYIVYIHPYTTDDQIYAPRDFNEYFFGYLKTRLSPGGILQEWKR